MKKIFSTVIFLSLVLGISSCSSSGSKETNSDEVMTTEIVVDEPVVYGENSELYSVVPGTYTLKRDDKLKIKIKLKLEKNPDGEIDFISGYGPKMQLKDEDGLNVIEGWDQMKLADGEKEKLETFLTKEPGSEIEVLYVNEFDYSQTEDAINKTKSFAIIDLDLVYKDNSETTDTDSENDSELAENSSKASKSEIDKFLDEYEKAVDKYVKDMKKAKEDGGLLGMASATTSMTVEITKLVDKLDKFSYDMTMEQAARFANIQSKMSLATADSAMDMLF